MDSEFKTSNQTEILTALVNLIQVICEKVYESKVYDSRDKMAELINEKILQREIDKLEFKVQFYERKMEKMEREIEQIKNKINE